MTDFDVNKSMEAQRKYCEDNDVPHFASKNGHCWSCKKNIYMQRHWKFTGGMNKTLVDKEVADHSTGITTKEASETLVIGCPHCNRSYCD
jgi:hypothetical protein